MKQSSTSKLRSTWFLITKFQTTVCKISLETNKPELRQVSLSSDVSNFQCYFCDESNDPPSSFFKEGHFAPASIYHPLQERPLL